MPLLKSNSKKLMTRTRVFRTQQRRPTTTALALPKVWAEAPTHLADVADSRALAGSRMCLRMCSAISLVLADNEAIEIAFDDLNRTIQINPRQGAAWFLRGLVWLWHKDEPEKAIYNVQQAIRLGVPEELEYDAYLTRGRLQVQLK